ncbi:PREDICTED: ABC transporter B family member 1-like [Branchiostoma belcheri]|uniref:ABC transporter B family member 1-like n=1 Tax=Branchiostoma belcheri TaxID=7741 RepID=A0A6P4XT42_BRABE|nr:PREDICTED: ABC transporter B family member 1-like [Branchiostoma belcheri]XP_019619832.1 PREDICTED: ABC transporter B family member 1-like [Branchiostoma belcheri]
MEGTRAYYTLPFFRFTNFVRFVVFIDGVVCVALWLAGGHTSYLEDNVVHFDFYRSVFELACLSLLRMCLLFHFFTRIEEISMKLLEEPYDRGLLKKRKAFYICAILLSLLSTAYAATKGGFVLYKESYKEMHSAYVAVCIASFVFSILELLLGLVFLCMVRKLQVMRIVHRYNSDGQEIDDEGNTIKKKVDLWRLFTMARDEWWILGLGCLAMLAASASNMMAPLFFSFVVDAALTSIEKVNHTVLVLLLIYIGGAIAAFFRSWLFTLAGMRFVARLREELFAAIIKNEIAFFDTTRTGELTNRLASDTGVVQNSVTVNISMLFRYLIQIIGSLSIMFVLSAKLTGVLLSCVPIVSIGAVVYGKYVQGIRKAFQDELAAASTVAEESISSIRTVRMFSGEEKSKRDYNKSVDKSYGWGKKLALAGGGFNGIVGVVAFGAIVLVLWYGAKLVIMEKEHPGTGLTIGSLTGFMMYTLNVAMAFAFISSLFGDFMQALGASERIFELLDRKAEVNVSGGKVLDGLNGGIVFKNVSFTYPSRPDSEVLKEVSFSVEPGKVVALVGPSGGGKSTIVSLIERFYDPNSGTIMLGGQDLSTLDPRWFRQQISMVSQEPTLFATTIKENIAYGREASDEEVEDAARQANAHQFISEFEEGYETMVGERGVRLSGGQKQRVAIARSLIMNPAILLLDEATSALDAESEHLVQEAIDRAMKGRTVLVIAHRLSTVRNASEVVVIDKGKIVERGTHDELLQKGGVYKKLVLRQLSAGRAMPSINTDAADIEEEESQEGSEGSNESNGTER